MTAASMTAKPTLFPIASTFRGTLTRPVWYTSLSLHEQRERWTTSMGGLSTHALTLKALQFSEWCMPAASTGVSTSSGYVTAGGADPTTLSRMKNIFIQKLR